MRKRYLILICAFLGLLGAGCVSREDGGGGVIFGGRSGIQALEKLVERYQQIEVDPEATWQTRTVFEKKEMRLKLPSGTGEDGLKWQIGEDEKNFIRMNFFPTVGPSQQWEDQKMSDKHEVIFTSEENGRFFLIANYDALRSTKLKLFLSDIESGQQSYFLECSIAYESSDQERILRACKTAMESVEGYTLR